MRTLLTGAGGYIGLHIVRELLEHGHQVTAVVRSPGRLGPFARDSRLTVVETDLEHEARIAQVLPGHDACVHAALIWGEPGSEFEVRDTAVAAKLFEAAARAACAWDQMTGVVIRPGPVVGPPAFPAGSFRVPNRIAEMVATAVEGRPIETVRGEGRQFSDVSTVARATRLLTQTENPHPTYLCVDRELLTWERVARMVVGCLNSSSDVRVLRRNRQGPIPRFRTERLEGLLGGPSDAEGALLAQIRHLARAGGGTQE